MTNRLIRPIRVLGLLAIVAGAAACSGILDVESPGQIADSDLNSKDAVPGIVVGISNRMSHAMAESGDAVVIFSALASAEMWHGGSYAWSEVPRGHIDPEDANTVWGVTQEWRFTAEDGIRRMRDEIYTGDNASEFGTSAYAARAYLLAGMAERTLGENFCSAVIDGSAEMDRSVYFQRAQAKLDSAIAIATAAGDDDVMNAAYGVRASVRAWQGDWSGAVSDAQKVPAAFVYYAIMQLPSPDNDLVYETHDRYEYTVWNTFMMAHPNDTRAPWTTLFVASGDTARGANGQTPMLQENKYEDQGADVPMVQGTEMLLLQAEAALRNSDIPTAYDLMNQARDVYQMAHLTAASTMEGAWMDLQYERSATVWLQGRHLWDMARWFQASPPERNSFTDVMQDRDLCIPVSQSEIDSNPNIP